MVGWGQRKKDKLSSLSGVTRSSPQRVAVKNGHPACRVEPCIWPGVQKLGRWGPACQDSSQHLAMWDKGTFPSLRELWGSTEVPCSKGHHLNLHRLGNSSASPSVGGNHNAVSGQRLCLAGIKKKTKSRVRDRKQEWKLGASSQNWAKSAGYLDFLNS